VSISALDLLKTLVYLWYSSGTKERLIFLEMVVDLAYTVEWNWRKNVVKLERCKTWSRAGALIITI